MLNRRQFLLTSFALLAAVRRAAAHPETSPALDPQFLPQEVDFVRDYPIGTIVVDTANRFLYLVKSKNIARRYGIGVGRAGLAFSGAAEIGRKAKWPSWRPTDNMIRRDPGKYARYADGVPGGPGNPLGSRALYLYRDGQDTLYRIHGTTEPSSIGKAVSNGCFRMLNEHVEDLFERVPVGAKVVVD
ncbi:L,D-transpeptidase [Mesorhizobium sp. Z1-4]|uniref:L,D-transpeptidase n=1 Tax=Mesorhizobium sp. Z1-4 TaxID=2448478 RepID=UPI000FD78C02|nr:L,D-transpeptidase [Mesorhizobium sp. Z1-4]